MKVKDVADVGSAPGVDGLVVVAGDEQRAASRSQPLDQNLLHGVDVLILINQKVANPLGRANRAWIVGHEGICDEPDHQ